MNLLKSGYDNDWEKIVVNLLSLIENFIQQGNAGINYQRLLLMN